MRKITHFSPISPVFAKKCHNYFSFFVFFIDIFKRIAYNLIYRFLNSEIYYHIQKGIHSL